MTFISLVLSQIVKTSTNNLRSRLKLVTHQWCDKFFRMLYHHLVGPCVRSWRPIKADETRGMYCMNLTAWWTLSIGVSTRLSQWLRKRRRNER